MLIQQLRLLTAELRQQAGQVAQRQLCLFRIEEAARLTVGFFLKATAGRIHKLYRGMIGAQAAIAHARVGV